MIDCKLLSCLVSLCLIAGSVRAQTVTTSDSTITYHYHSQSPPAPLSAVGRNNPLEFFIILGKLPLEAQKAYLNVTGAKMQRQQNLVDCAYYTDDEIEVQEDPTASLKQFMEANGHADLEKACPECFSNQIALWCAQTVPKCGSYSGTIENVLLPAITTVAKSQTTDQTPLEALAAAVPELLSAFSLAMPCSQMCEAIVSSCSCSKEQQFGVLLDAFIARAGAGVPPGFTAQIFGSVYHKPLCSLYGNNSDSRFVGTCTPLESTCTNPQKWCGVPGEDSTGSEVVQELMAGQLANALFGWVDAPASNLLQDERGAIDSADDTDAKSLEQKYLKQGSTGGSTSGSAGATVAHWSVFAVLVVLALAAGVAFWRRRTSQQRQAHDGYMSMAAVEEGLDFDEQLVPHEGPARN